MPQAEEKRMNVSPLVLLTAASPNAVSVGDRIERRVGNSIFGYRVSMVYPFLRLVGDDGRSFDPNHRSNPAHRIVR